MRPYDGGGVDGGGGSGGSGVVDVCGGDDGDVVWCGVMMVCRMVVVFGDSGDSVEACVASGLFRSGVFGGCWWFLCDGNAAKDAFVYDSYRWCVVERRSYIVVSGGCEGMVMMMTVVAGCGCRRGVEARGGE
ncbi:hypothetical protein Tco_1467803 [Tanacetum coccineum]